LSPGGIAVNNPKVKNSVGIRVNQGLSNLNVFQKYSSGLGGGIGGIGSGISGGLGVVGAARNGVSLAGNPYSYNYNENR